MRNSRNKYHARKVTIGGLTFDSQREADRWTELQILEGKGLISHLHRQARFTLIPAQYINGRCVERSCSYIADFVYIDEKGEKVVEDVKGMCTAEYVIKRKLMLQEYGLRIREVR